MATICINGVRECDACMACQSEPAFVGECEHCGKPIPAYEDHYQLPDGELLHEDCARDYLREHFLVPGR